MISWTDYLYTHFTISQLTMGILETDEVFLSLKTSIKLNGIACRTTCVLIGKYALAYIVNTKWMNKNNSHIPWISTYRQAVCRFVGPLARWSVEVAKGMHMRPCADKCFQWESAWTHTNFFQLIYRFMTVTWSSLPIGVRPKNADVQKVESSNCVLVKVER